MNTTFWQPIIAKYQTPHLRRSIWQIVNSFVPYLILWYLMQLSLEISYWLTLGLSILAAGFLVRIFIIFHDCGHGCFFKSRKANDIWGYITGILTLTPYHQWRHDHAVHHATSSDLDRRGVGDIWTLTVEEYLKSPRLTKIFYRVYRNPLVLFGIGGVYLILIRQRFPSRAAASRERGSVLWTNLALAGLMVLMSFTVGFVNTVLIYLPILLISSAAGVWLFYVQHQFEGAYWEQGENWDYVAAALQGSSFYNLPRVLQWFSGNIGFHHIHHLSPRIPNYHLERCHKNSTLFSQVKRVTLFSSLKSFAFRLWDEEGQRLVGYRFLKKSFKEKLNDTIPTLRDGSDT